MAEAEQLAEALNESPTRHDALTEAFAQAEKEDQAPEETPAQKSERLRDESGKFVAKPKEKEATAPSGEQGAASPPAPPPAAQPEPVWKTKTPQSWKKDYHEVWQTVPENVREYVWQREEQMKAGVQPLLSKAEQFDAINQVVEPYLPTIKGLGHTVPQVIKTFFEADKILRSGNPQEKLAYIGQIAHNYGVDLSQLTGMASQAAPVDPNYGSLQNRLIQLEGRLKVQQEQQEEAERQLLRGEIEKFASAPGHEHYETVKPTMATLLQSGAAKDLEDAYTKAVRLDDSLFESLMRASQAKVIEDKDKVAKTARAAAVSVRGSTPGSHTATKAQTRRDVIAEQVGSAESRV